MPKYQFTAREVQTLLNGFICLFKPKDVSISSLEKRLLKNICDANHLDHDRPLPIIDLPIIECHSSGTLMIVGKKHQIDYRFHNKWFNYKYYWVYLKKLQLNLMYNIIHSHLTSIFEHASIDGWSNVQSWGFPTRIAKLFGAIKFWDMLCVYLPFYFLNPFFSIWFERWLRPIRWDKRMWMAEWIYFGRRIGQRNDWTQN